MTEFIILMASMMSLVALSIDTMLPALGVMGEDLNASSANQTQLIIGFLFVGMTIGLLLAGPLSDSIGRKKTLFIGLGIFLLGTLVCYLAKDMETMLAGRLIQGIGVSGPRMGSIAIVRDKFAGRDMAKIMSLIMAIFILVPAIAPSLGQLILMFGTWHMIFAVFLVMAIIITVWTFFRLEETLHPEDKIAFNFRSIGHGFAAVFGNRVAMSYTLCMGICFGSFIGYLTSCRQIYQDHYQIGEYFSLAFGGLALVLGAASLVNSRIVQKTGMRFLCLRSTLVIIVASAIFLALNFAMAPPLWMFMSYAAILFFSFGLMFGNLNAIAMEPMGHIAGIASAVIGSVSTLISMIIGAGIGQLYNDTLIPVVAGFLIMNIVSLGVMMFAERKTETI